MDARTILSPADTAGDLAGTAFTHVGEHLAGVFRTADFATAVRLLDEVAVVADELNHHPDVRLGWGRVEFELTSHDVGGVTSRDVALARRIGEIAAEQGARPGS
ncbi:4a-hydroxytetrahydrobiopterin dehydratase [Agromyces cerinus]|uniref:Putative pterin-4-alpha-carbinolamine dehydratase n=1 Tax=Agromyces cerinus subsp. cerinus TaxID=232089 RepID=A0A1N6H8T5_9MICO|nr:4a-hydroxytetrahydrobiopterin dehydratase [Agromyces cerinus]SIO16231.1 4a-hydroxytetrahydrobiopterin dehydratase [Agromyces cerinus subsp. cerinus]